MKTLSIDLETYSSIELRKAGAYAYASSPDFEILLFGYAFDDEPAQTIDLTREELPQNIVDAIYDPAVIKMAFNAQFERACLARYLGTSLDVAAWFDTAVLARELGLPGSLEQVGEVIGLPEDKQKLKTGKALIRYFSIPCKPTKANGERTRNLPKHDPDKWALYVEYNRQDVEAERAIRKRLEKFAVAPSEWELWKLDQNINDRGVLFDRELAEAAVEIDASVQAEILAKAQALTGLDNPKSQVQLKNWIEDTAFIEVESLDKKHVAQVRAAADLDIVNQVLDLRAGLSKTSTKKYEAMLNTSCPDDRIRGLTMFYGAGRTGRWAGRLVQMQNLPQNKMPDDDLDIARALVKARDIDSLRILFADIPGTLSQLIRTAFIPTRGCKFIVSDFSAIEARVIAWLANETWRLNVFNTHGKIYEASAEKMFHLPAGSVKKGDPMRTKGKIAELALGYGGSVGALKSMGALDMGLTEEELKPLVVSWRNANKAITAFWWEVDNAVRTVISHGARVRLSHGIEVYRQGPLMRIKLPSGRSLSYVNPQIINDAITYSGVEQTTGKWGTIETYGPKIVENIVQATARDCLAESIKRLESIDLPIVFHVHDEVIAEVPINGPTAEDIAEIMGQEISWAPGLPLKADAYECEYYRKE